MKHSDHKPCCSQYLCLSYTQKCFINNDYSSSLKISTRREKTLNSLTTSGFWNGWCVFFQNLQVQSQFLPEVGQIALKSRKCMAWVLFWYCLSDDWVAGGQSRSFGAQGPGTKFQLCHHHQGHPGHITELCPSVCCRKGFLTPKSHQAVLHTSTALCPCPSQPVLAVMINSHEYLTVSSHRPCSMPTVSDRFRCSSCHTAGSS